jgi:hypothetical protein
MSDCSCFYFEPDHRLPKRYGLGAAALRYAALGYAVIPLARGGKRPHQMLGDRGGIHLASKDPDQIMDWWGLDMVANIGVATGSDNRLAVVDLDVKGGQDGPGEWLAFLSRMGSSVPYWAPHVQTPSGGWHVWMRAEATPERPGILPGVDIKGDGGLVVAPPSMAMIQPASRPGERGSGEVPVPYEQAGGCPHAVPDAPPWFGQWLAEAPPAPRAGGGTVSGAPVDEVLETYMQAGLPPGMRNRELYRTACGLYRRHGTHTAGSAQVMEIIRGIYANTDKTDFGWNEVLTCAESARRFVETSTARENARNAEFLGWLERRPWNRLRRGDAQTGATGRRVSLTPQSGPARELITPGPADRTAG